MRDLRYERAAAAAKAATLSDSWLSALERLSRESLAGPLGCFEREEVRVKYEAYAAEAERRRAAT
jgi:hypothetical protein